MDDNDNDIDNDNIYYDDNFHYNQWIATRPKRTRWMKEFRISSFHNMKVTCQEFGLQMSILVLISFLAMGITILEIQKPPQKKKKSILSLSTTTTTTTIGTTMSTTTTTATPTRFTTRQCCNFASSAIIGCIVLFESALCHDQLAYMESIVLPFIFHVFMKRLEEHFSSSNGDDDDEYVNNKDQKRRKRQWMKHKNITLLQVLHQIPRYLSTVTILGLFWFIFTFEEVSDDPVYYDDGDDNNGSDNY